MSVCVVNILHKRPEKCNKAEIAGVFTNWLKKEMHKNLNG
jgi:hypothetical protein